MSTTQLNPSQDNPLNIRLGKICRLCDLSCEGRPRVKDSHGRYYCRSCYQEQRRRGAERQRQRIRPRSASRDASRAAAQGPFMHVDADAFADLNVDPQRRCPGCREFIGQSDLVCIHCGFNHTTGRQHQTAVEPSEPTINGRAEHDVRAWSLRSILTNGWVVFAGIQIPFLIIFFNASARGPRGVDELWPILFAFDAVVWLGVVIAAAMSSVGWALGCLFIPFVSVWWVYMENESALLKILVTVTLVNEAVRVCL